MIKILSSLLMICSAITGFSQTTEQPALIPAPVSQQLSTGFFTLPKAIVIEAKNQQTLSQPLSELKSHLSIPTGYTVTVASSNPTAAIRLVLNRTPETNLGAEGYTLSVTPKTILIKANQPAGLFYGVQTLLQLLPNEIENHGLVKKASWQIPCTTITDYPRFGWRGLMLDVSRHFFTKEQVKGFIDEMAK